MRTLSHDDILSLHSAIVSARLLDQRAALLTGIDPVLVASLPAEANPAAQILADLHLLNEVGTTSDGSVPLQTWLANAFALAGPRASAAVFQEQLSRTRAQQPPAISVRGRRSRLALAALG